MTQAIKTDGELMNKQPKMLHDEVPVMRETKLTKQISEDDEKFKRYENELS